MFWFKSTIMKNMSVLSKKTNIYDISFSISEQQESRIGLSLIEPSELIPRFTTFVGSIENHKATI